MANYRDMGIADVSFLADVDLTQKQYYFVMPASTAGNVTTSTGACNPAPLGVLQNSPSLGQEATVRILGFTKLVCEVSTCNLVWRRFIFCASDGQGEAIAVAGSLCNGRFMQADVTSGSLIAQVQLFDSSASVGAQI